MPCFFSGRPLVWREAHGDPTRGPGNDRPFDGAGMRQHDLFGAFAARQARLHGSVQFAPSCAFAVEQGFPAHSGQPSVQLRFGHALFFEIVKDRVQAVIGQPGAGFFDGVAVGNAVNNGVHGALTKLNVTRLGDNRRL